MGIFSPFTSFIQSPSLAAKHGGNATPCQSPLLEMLDELKGVEEAVAPIVNGKVAKTKKGKRAFVPVQAFLESSRSNEIDDGSIDDMCDMLPPAMIDSVQPPRSYAIPDWPGNAPPTFAGLMERNTFLDGSMMCNDESDSDDDLYRQCYMNTCMRRSWSDPALKTLPSETDPVSMRADAECYVPSSYGAMMMVLVKTDEFKKGGDQSEQSKTTRTTPYRPFWAYGSVYPFNCAPTTLTLRNLPSGLTAYELEVVLNTAGFTGCYDFLYVETSLRTGKCVGTATVNVTRHSYGNDIADFLHGFSAWSVGSGKQDCEVLWSIQTQGLASLVEYYRDQRTNHESVPDVCKPMIYDEGWQVPFPAATRLIRAPRLGPHW